MRRISTLLIAFFVGFLRAVSGLLARRLTVQIASPLFRALPCPSLRPRRMRATHLRRGFLPLRTGPPCVVAALVLAVALLSPALAQIPISKVTGLQAQLNKLTNQSRTQITAQAMTKKGAKFPATTWAAPTVTLSAAGASTGITSATTYNGYEPSARTTLPFTTAKPATIGVSPFFCFTGCKPQQAGGGSPDTVLVKSVHNSSGSDNGAVAVEFYHFGSQLELIVKGQGGKIRVNVDGNDVVLATNGIPASNDTWPTAQAGAASTITLAASSSATNDAYSGWWIETMAGTGSGQSRRITNYVGSTKVATITPNWSTNPDNTTTYRMSSHRTGGFSAPGASGSMYNILMDWSGVRGRRHFRIEMSNAYFGGVRTGPNDSLWPAVPDGGPVMVVVGDSLVEGTGAGSRWMGIGGWLAAELGCQPYLCGSGGTGYLNPSSVAGRMTIPDRVLPPATAHTYYHGGATGGTFKFSVTAGGSTQTSASGIAYNASVATLKSELEALSNVGSGNVDVYGPCAGVYYVLPRNALATTGAFALTIDSTSITGGSAGARFCNAYQGDVLPYIPTDATGAQLPFYLVFAAGYNDTTNSNAAYTTTALRTAASAVWRGAQAKFPTATILVLGSHCPSSTIASYLSDAESALAAEAVLSLRKVNGYVPFVSQHGWINGTGSIGAETGTGNADYCIYNDAVHSSDEGHQMFGQRAASEFATMLGIRLQDGYLLLVTLVATPLLRRRRKALFSMDA